MARYRWQIVIAISLLAVSAACYTVQTMLFHRSSETFFYVLQDFGFLPIQVLMVTLVIDQLLKRRERNVLRQKLNMVIGAFFNEMGTTLLKYFARFDKQIEEVQNLVSVAPDWSSRQFTATRKRVLTHSYNLDCHCADMGELKEAVLLHRPFLLDLIGNPSLLEQESFTELLWAISHLTEELASRQDLDSLPDPDYDHLAQDMKRAYVLLISEWLLYVQHLRDNYPFMFSFVVRTNPFNPESSPVVENGA